MLSVKSDVTGELVFCMNAQTLIGSASASNTVCSVDIIQMLKNGVIVPVKKPYKYCRCGPFEHLLFLLRIWKGSMMRITLHAHLKYAVCKI